MIISIDYWVITFGMKNCMAANPWLLPWVPLKVRGHPKKVGGRGYEGRLIIDQRGRF